MTDATRIGFLNRQYEEGTRLATASDRFHLLPIGPTPPERYGVVFTCAGLVKSPQDGTIIEARRFEVGIWFPSDYLRRASMPQVLYWLGPSNVFHPNIHGPKGAICVGRLIPGTSLVDILYQVYEMITWQKARLDHALNWEAAAWARSNRQRLPVDRRPLKRRAIESDMARLQNESGTGRGVHLSALPSASQSGACGREPGRSLRFAPQSED